MDERIHLLGIRHHGPGSAALVCQALDQLDPQVVLIEGSPEADALIPFAALPGMKPPIALLSYALDQPSIAVFSPFAEFSPEWQAMNWALKHQRPVRFIDWPVSVALAEMQAGSTLPETDETPQDFLDQIDPLDLLGEAAGYADGESFWNSLIEQQAGSRHDALAVFASIEQAMNAAREWQESSQSIHPFRLQREQRREAHMRINVRQAAKEYPGAIAVVLGAWHLRGLRQETSQAADKAIIKDLPKIKTETLWVPWTNGRLAMRSGYGAGVLSPGWYEQLWQLYHKNQDFAIEGFVAQWISRTTQLLRHAGYAASTASALEATRLAITLAAMRELSTPGLPEMREATLAVLCQGNPTSLAVIEEQLYIGEKLGTLDPAVPQMPLATDLEKWQRKTRLLPSGEAESISLDLRSEAGLLKSTLLHRLLLIDLPWGTLTDAAAGRGTFREIWSLQWKPEFAVSLAEALVYGVTIEQAAAGRARVLAQKAPSIQELAELIKSTLVADLPETAGFAIDCLQKKAVDSNDMSALMHAVAPLVQILRYGTARAMPEAELRALVHALCVEINAGIRIACYQLDETATAERLQAVSAYHQSLNLFGSAELSQEWQRQLGLLVHDELTVPALAGLGLRCLHDDNLWSLEAVSQIFSLHINGQAAQHAGSFLEAFIGSNAEVLLHDQVLLHLINDWLSELTEDDFMAIIPLLRRSFSSFDLVAKRRLFQAVFDSPRSQQPDQPDQTINPAFEAALPLLFQILGVKNEHN